MEDMLFHKRGIKSSPDNLKPKKPGVWQSAYSFRGKRALERTSLSLATSVNRKCKTHNSCVPFLLTVFPSPDSSCLTPSHLHVQRPQPTLELPSRTWSEGKPARSCLQRKGRSHSPREQGSMKTTIKCYILNLEQQQKIHIFGNFQILFPTTVVTKYQW